MINKTIILFDMDGTLTPAREAVTPGITEALIELTKRVKVGIITGSDYDYVCQQMKFAFDFGLPKNKVDILPCNGTKRYQCNSTSGEYSLTYDSNMIEKIGRESYNSILAECSKWQNLILREYDELPFTGTFFQYRNSLLNWCPIGRNAGNAERKSWVLKDEKNGIRLKYKNLLETFISKNLLDVTVALGGSTSLDIYPDGWDKTFGLDHYPDNNIYFVGDRCEVGGNDFAIYEFLKKKDRSYKTESPEETVKIIKNLMDKI